MLSDDTRLWWATRLQKAAQRVASGPQLRIPEGTQLIDSEALSALVANAMGDNEDDEPLDPEQMKRDNLAYAMSMNDDVEPLVEHVRSIRKNLMAGPDGFTEEAAEHMCMGVWHGILGGMIEDE